MNENWRKRYNKELIELFGDLDILSFVRVSRLEWIGHVNRMDSKSKVFNNNPQESRLSGRQKNRWWNCVQTHVNKCKIKKWKKRSKDRADSEKSIKEVKLLIGLYCHLRR